MFNVITSHSNQLLQEVENPKQEEEEETGVKKGVDEEISVEKYNESKSENPLDKYMKMVLEAREKQHAQVSCMHVCLRLLYKLNRRLDADWSSLGLFFFYRALEEKRQNMQAQRPRVCLRIKKTGKLKPLTWLDKLFPLSNSKAVQDFNTYISLFQ